MKYSEKILSQVVVDYCKQYNIQHVVISPGSRNAPLTIGFTHNTNFKCYSIVDERCAAFFALGIAQNLNTPVAIVCTSGSALLNYFPAISEAFYSRIPIIVLSADRPEHLVGIGDGQTIDQKNVYGSHSFFNANLSSEAHKLEENKTLISQALKVCIKESGPIHINIPFNEPLYNTVNVPSLPSIKLEDTTKLSKPITVNIPDDIKEEWFKADKKMVLVGVLKPNSLEDICIKHLSEDPNVIVLTETTSNLTNNTFFPSIDQLIAPLQENELTRLQPDVLLTFGGLVVSKKIKAFLRAYKPKKHWHVDKYMANDTFFILDKHIKITANRFLKNLYSDIPKAQNQSDYKQYWTNVKTTRLNKHKSYLNTIPYSDFKVFHTILNQLPNNIVLQVSNSSAIRYTQLFKIKPSVNVFCNRGTSGIDGSTSTAIGYASSSNKQVVLITGDLSFLYDSNALWNNYIPNSFRIIVVNNEGGGIFRILPGSKDSEEFDTFFETKHQLNAEHLCKMYNIDYDDASNEDTLKTKLKTFYAKSNRPKLLEIFTPSKINDKVLLEYFKNI